MTEIEPSIGARLRSLRRNLGLTQSKMAERLGIADKTYKNYESDQRELPVKVAVRLCDCYGTDLLWLLTGEPSFPKEIACDLVARTAEVMQTEAIARKLTLLPAQARKIGKFIFSTSATNGSDPKDNAGQVFDLLL